MRATDPITGHHIYCVDGLAQYRPITYIDGRPKLMYYCIEAESNYAMVLLSKCVVHFLFGKHYLECSTLGIFHPQPPSKPSITISVPYALSDAVHEHMPNFLYFASK